MESLIQMEIKATKLYKQLELGLFFDTYHDIMFDLVSQFDYLEIDDEEDYKIGAETLAKCEAIIEAQKLLSIL
jgi:hypothetical protein